MDMILDERWNTIDSAEMALGVRRAIDLVYKEEKISYEYDKYLDKGIKFLDEAIAGGALISGMIEEADSFNGTFSPLCLATDVYIAFKNENPEKMDDYGTRGKIGKLLSSYKNVLVQIKQKELLESLDKKEISEIRSFFKVLFDLLHRQADPITKEYSYTSIF